MVWGLKSRLWVSAMRKMLCTASCLLARKIKSENSWASWRTFAWVRKRSRKRRRKPSRTTCIMPKIISRQAMWKWRSSSTWSRPEITEAPRHSLKWPGAIRTALVWKKMKKMRSCGTKRPQSRAMPRRSALWALKKMTKRPANGTKRRRLREM